jgi:hypothetical protein
MQLAAYTGWQGSYHTRILEYTILRTNHPPFTNSDSAPISQVGNRHAAKAGYES